MESYPPNIPQGFDMSTTTKPAPEPEVEEREEEDYAPTDLELAEAYCKVQESNMEVKRMKFDMLVDAMSRPYPESWVPGQVMEHPFFTPDDQDLLKAKLIDFLLKL